MIGSDGGPVRVLLVEDYEPSRRLIRSTLEMLGITDIREAADGGAGLAALAEFAADLVIVDYRMSPMDGLAFTRQLRRASGAANPYVPVLMVTGYSDPALVAAARDAGVNEFLAKPLSPKMLLSRVVRVLDTPRPFISTAGYFGPDRRRRQVPIAHAERRRRSGP